MQAFHAIYHKTVCRDGATGDSEFLLLPKEAIAGQLDDGLVRCYGKACAFTAGTPVDVSGSFMDGGRFAVEDIKAAGTTEELLRYLFGHGLPDAEIAQVRRLAGDGLMEFCGKGNAIQLITSALSAFPDGRLHAKKIYEGISGLKDAEGIFSLFCRLGIPLKLTDTLAANAFPLWKVKKDPYAAVAYGLDPCDADRIAAEAQRDAGAYSAQRVAGYLRHAADAMLKKGSTCLPFGLFCRSVSWKAGQSPWPGERLTPSIIFRAAKSSGPVAVADGACVYAKKSYDAEQETVRHAARLQRSAVQLLPGIDTSRAEAEAGFTYNAGQRAAFRALRTSGVKILTGPPGSGKTAVIRGLISAYKEAFPKDPPALLATTGAASQVLKNATGLPAQTIHKCLGIRPMGQKMLYAKDINNPIPSGLIIADEASMLDLETCAALFGAVKSGSLLLLVGDEFQLQSVGYGDVLHGLIHSGAFEVYRLSEVMRQSGLICENAAKIHKGDAGLSDGDGFQVFRYGHGEEEEALHSFLSAVDAKNSIALSPVKKGVLGTQNINREMQAMVQEGQDPCMRYGGAFYYPGDRIVMARTDYNLGYFNGDIGEVLGLNGSQLEVRFRDKVLGLPKEAYPDIALAYALTVHKAQGSEKEDVHILLPDEPENMLTRRLLYTAVTRAKKKVGIYCIGDAIEKAVSNNKEQKRYSNLTEKLRETIGG